ncbi:type II secretion system protein J [Chloroflexota bacterium]
MRQRGFTVIEILVTLAVSSVIALVVLLSLTQVFQGTGRSNSQVIVLDDLHRVALQVKKDLQSQQSANLTDLQYNPTTFYWTEQTGFAPEDERDHYSTYSLSGTTLQRTADNITSILGRHITYLSFTENGEYIDAVITATSSTFPPRTETLNFSVNKRTEEVEE